MSLKILQTEIYFSAQLRVRTVNRANYISQTLLEATDGQEKYERHECCVQYGITVALGDLKSARTSLSLKFEPHITAFGTHVLFQTCMENIDCHGKYLCSS